MLASRDLILRKSLKKHKLSPSQWAGHGTERSGGEWGRINTSEMIPESFNPIRNRWLARKKAGACLSLKRRCTLWSVGGAFFPALPFFFLALDLASGSLVVASVGTLLTECTQRTKLICKSQKLFFYRSNQFETEPKKQKRSKEHIIPKKEKRKTTTEPKS